MKKYNSATLIFLYYEYLYFWYFKYILPIKVKCFHLSDILNPGIYFLREIFFIMQSRWIHSQCSLLQWGKVISVKITHHLSFLNWYDLKYYFTLNVTYYQLYEMHVLWPFLSTLAVKYFQNMFVNLTGLKLSFIWQLDLDDSTQPSVSHVLWKLFICYAIEDFHKYHKKILYLLGLFFSRSTTAWCGIIYECFLGNSSSVAC